MLFLMFFKCFIGILIHFKWQSSSTAAQRSSSSPRRHGVPWIKLCAVTASGSKRRQGSSWAQESTSKWLEIAVFECF